MMMRMLTRKEIIQLVINTNRTRKLRLNSATILNSFKLRKLAATVLDNILEGRKLI